MDSLRSRATCPVDSPGEAPGQEPSLDARLAPGADPAREVEQDSEPRPAAVPSGRACLRCGGMFPSAWAGERVCGRCKDSVAWRQGLPYRSSSPSHRG
ncbi:MAG: hypothetical protein WD341_05165 [Tistlia sp.]|uniref:hypothetical protein n=1 Tax=Tistlia sp. TaxID=3057121 RepID=UPI0034A1A9C5